jgi:hypothetical protein
MAVTGDLRPRQIAVTCLVPSVILVLRLAVSFTSAGFGRATRAIPARSRVRAMRVSRARSATAARGRVTAILVPVGWIGWPTLPDVG